MKTRLHELTKWMVAMLLCTVSLTAFAVDESDFADSTITISGEEEYIHYNLNTDWEFEDMVNGKPCYSMSFQEGDFTITCRIHWVITNGLSGGNGDGCWTIDDGAKYMYYNNEATDTVPMNGWMLDGDHVNATFTISGCVTDNIVPDPLAGTTITIKGSDAVNGTYEYTEMLDDRYPSYATTIGDAEALISMEDDEWQISLDSVVKFTNDLGGSLIPENNWVSVDESTDYITLSSVEGATVNYFADNSPEVTGSTYSGGYIYYTMVGAYPAYAMLAGDYRSVVYKNDTAWVLAYGSNLTTDLTSYTIEAYTLKGESYLVPQNGWTNGVELSGNGTEYIMTGETLTLSGSDFDTEFVFSKSGENFNTFISTNGEDTTKLTSVNGTWEIIYNDSVCYTYPEETQSMSSAPKFGWIDTDDNYVALTIEGNLTTDEFSGKEVKIDGLSSYTSYFDYDSPINGRLSFVTEDGMVLKCVADVWGIYADEEAATPTYTSTATTDFFVPQNGWDNTLTVQSSDVTTYVFTGSVVTASNTSSDADGDYTFDSINSNGSPVFTRTVNDITYSVYNDYGFVLKKGDETLYTCENTISIDGLTPITQNTWVAETEGAPAVYFTGEFTVDYYAGKELTATYSSGSTATLEYNGMINDYPSFGSDDGLMVSFDGSSWIIASGSDVLYTNTNASSLIPANMWVAVSGGESIMLAGNNLTSYFYEDVIISGLSLDIANGAYTISDNDASKPQFTKEITTGEYAGSTLVISYRSSKVQIMLNAADYSTTFLCENSNTSKNDAGKYVVPQNFWKVDGEYDSSIKASGSSTYSVEGVLVDALGYSGLLPYISGAYRGYIANVDYDEMDVAVQLTDTAWILWDYTDVIAYNNVINADSVPQNQWYINGVVDTTLSILGNETFDVENFTPPAYVAPIDLTGNADGFDGTYEYVSAGKYSMDFHGMDINFELNENADTSYWMFNLVESDDVGGVSLGNDVVSSSITTTLATNTNVSGTLVPQNNWILTGEVDVDSLFVVSGDSTFFVEDAPASIVDAKSVDFTIYPNPAQFDVNIDATSAAVLNIYSLTGSVVMSAFLEQGHNIISIDALEKGVYLLVTTLDGKREVSRLVKE